jgi:hypothetical protein
VKENLHLDPAVQAALINANATLRSACIIAWGTLSAAVIAALIPLVGSYLVSTHPTAAPHPDVTITVTETVTVMPSQDVRSEWDNSPYMWMT